MIVVDLFKRFEVYSTLLLAFLIAIRQYAGQEDFNTMSKIVGVDFEVFGRVQGVFFRKYTESKAKELDLKGWCMNTKQGTVKGYIEGNNTQVEEMKNWLQHTGSPQSLIDEAKFSNPKELNAPTHENFVIKK